VAGFDTATGQAHLAVYDDLDRHIRYVGGGPATPTPSGQDVDVTASMEAAHSLGLTMGRRYCFLKVANLRNVDYEAGDHFCTRLVGVWRALSASDPYWAGLQPPAAALTLGAGAYFHLLQLLPATHSTGFVVFAPDLSRFHEAQATDLVDRFRRLRATIGLSGSASEVSTRLDAAMQDFKSRLQLARFSIELVLARLLLIAIYSVAFVSGHWGLRPGQVFTLAVDSVNVRFTIVDEADHVPTLYPETEDFMVADQAPLLDAIGYRGGERAWPDEAWLKVDAGADRSDLAALRARS
jgi:hypothetical protein